MNSVKAEIQEFALSALNRAERMLSRSDSCINFSVGGAHIELVETHPIADGWLSGQFANGHTNSTYQIYCDYTGWHVERSPSLEQLAATSEVEMDDILDDVALRGSFFHPLNRWDIFDAKRNLGVRFQTSPTDFPIWEPTAPFANHLSWIMRSEGKYIVHAATLGLGQNGVLLSGAGGSGKSGTTLSGIMAGLSTVGDDYIILSLDPEVIAEPFYHKVKQDQVGLERLGISIDPALHGKPNWQDKYVFEWNKIGTAEYVDHLKIHAILLPHVKHNDKTSLRSAGKFEVLNSLVPATMNQLSGGREDVFSFCANLTRKLPGYHLDLSDNSNDVANAVRNFIAEGKI